MRKRRPSRLPCSGDCDPNGDDRGRSLPLIAFNYAALFALSLAEASRVPLLRHLPPHRSSRLPFWTSLFGPSQACRSTPVRFFSIIFSSGRTNDCGAATGSLRHYHRPSTYRGPSAPSVILGFSFGTAAVTGIKIDPGVLSQTPVRPQPTPLGMLTAVVKKTVEARHFVGY